MGGGVHPERKGASRICYIIAQCDNGLLNEAEPLVRGCLTRLKAPPSGYASATPYVLPTLCISTNTYHRKIT
jgi:hypothetical protein